MKIRTMLYVVATYLAMYIGAGSYGVAGSMLELTQKPQEISGIDRESGVAFAALLTASDHVVIDASIGAKQIHADIDYNLQTLRIRSFSKANGASISLSDQDIVAFQKLLVSLPPAVDTGSQHGDALTSFVNLMANAPPVAIDISSSGPAFTPICKQIGGPGMATYTLVTGIQHDRVTVGPVCYVRPALGRCGANGGPDPVIGLVQRFTQECLNHDQCCVKTGDRIICHFGICVNICGHAGTEECKPEFNAAANGFFFAPDCGTTAGKWTDNYGYTYVLTGGDSSGRATAFSGKVNTSTCGTWNVAGTRTGKNIGFTATNPSGASRRCVASYAYVGAYTDCSVANGSWTNSGRGHGSWSWRRTNTVGAQTVSVGTDTFGPASARGPANGAP